MSAMPAFCAAIWTVRRMLRGVDRGSQLGGEYKIMVAPLVPSRQALGVLLGAVRPQHGDQRN
ncbi:hypothetical protein [Mycobacterium sp. 1274761.0]|uniref:hypothetical protein n=1 Tax=Mycobacterium sp. 1274761.0 TaxID=1834077 RepID=UPI002100A14D|nr:hypothetical protein [Mycobacterium sp. 1274761.0]